jgi:hypothetical protein
MATSIQDFVDTIAIKASIDPAAAETAVGTILSAIQQRRRHQGFPAFQSNTRSG